MRIGILTFWQSQSNYGQILQCWALQKYLISNGHDAFLIRYTHDNPKPQFKDKARKMLKIYPIFIKIIRLVKALIVNKEDGYINRSFNDFKNKYIVQSQRIYRNLVELQNDPPQADCYIVGSDQVWAHLLDNKNNEVYFLNFGDETIKRLSYAASFSMEYYPEFLNQRLAHNLSRFDAVSVREKVGVRICKNVGINAYWVLDPTLLLKKSDYNSFIQENHYEGQYAFLYLVNVTNPSDIYWNSLKSLVKEKDLTLICSTASGYNKITFTLDECIYEYPTIEKWLTLIYYSSIVITSSFHGVVFSLLFNKPFIFIPLLRTYSRSNNRVIDLLTKLNLSNRIINDANQYKNIINNKINWEGVNEKLDELRYDSQKFLLRNL